MNIPVAAPSLSDLEVQFVVEALRSGWISGGRFVEEFEREFAGYCGVSYGVATCNGTAALHLALAALGVGPGDEVIIPALTFVATANAVAYTGAVPVPVDVRADSWCLDPQAMCAAITRRTRAVIPVHLYGHPADMDAIKEACAGRLVVIEDAAEAHGAEIHGKRVGSFGDVGCFSFYGNKIITTGEGGMCITDNEALAARMRLLRSHGMSTERRYWHEEIGFNYRMTNLQAAVGVAQLRRLDELVEKKRAIANWYRERLTPLAERGLITLHPEAPGVRCVYWMYSLLVHGNGMSERLRTTLRQYGVETRPFFVPIHKLPPYRSEIPCPTAERLAAEGVNLPSGTTLDENTVDYICSLIWSALT
jgi:perosamine synthetase